MAPILLKCGHITQELDQAGVMVEKHVWSRYNPGYYSHQLLPTHMKPLDTLDYVPPLQFFCLKTLYPNVDSIDMGAFSRFPFHPDVHMAWVKGLIPFFTSDMRDEDLKYVDPRLWGTLIQLYFILPPCFHMYTLPLSDIHLSQLQAIRSTPEFTLITVLDLSSRPELTDETIGELKPLTNLCVLDLSLTGVGSWGVKKLSMCLVRNGDGRIGPWRLRVWSLRGCRTVDGTVKDALVKFPLLSAVDLRGTSVTPFYDLPGYTSRPPSTHTTFYYPNPSLSWIDGLCESFPDCQIFQSSGKQSLYVLHVNKLEYPKIFPPNRFREKTNRIGAMEQHSDVLACFPNGRSALYKTRDLSQESQGSITTSVSEKARRTVRSHHAYGPEDTYDFGLDCIGRVTRPEYEECSHHFSDHGSEYGHPDSYHLDDELPCHCSWCDDMSEDGHSNYYRSDDDRSESDASEHHQVPFDAGGTESRFDFDPNMSQRYSRSERSQLIRSVVQHNEVAALEAERHVSEQEAFRFYSKSDVPRLGSAGRLLTKRNDQEMSMPCPTGTPQSHKPADQTQWTRMFFRAPPAYDYISHDSAPETGHSHRTKLDETAVAKKRKTGVKPAGVPKALLYRQGRKGQTVGRASMGVECSQSAKSSFRSVTESHSCRPPVSMNPFLAKTRRPASSPSTSNLELPPTPYCHTEPEPPPTASMRPRIASRSQLQSQQSNVSIESIKVTALSSSAPCTTQPENGAAGSKKTNRTCLNLEEKLVKAKQREVNQAFDMRAWVMQTTRKN